MSPPAERPAPSVLRAPGLKGAPVHLKAPGGALPASGSGASRPRDATAQTDRPVVQAEAAQLSAAKTPEIPEEVLRMAEERGYEAGLARGREAARIEAADKLTRLDQVLGSIIHRREDLLDVLEDDIVDLAILAASAVIGEQVSGTAFAIQTVRQALARPLDGPVLAIRLAPGDFELLAELKKAGGDVGAGIELVGDASVGLGGCILETARGSLDLRLETRLQKLRASILEARVSKSAAVNPAQDPAGSQQP